MGDSSRQEVRYDLARDRARGLLTLTRQRPPVDVQAIINLAGIPVVERALPDGTRATIGDIAGRRSIILNRRWKFLSENERRWVLAEELGHALLGHRLVESTEPGKPPIGLLEPRRVFYEREARAFAAELLMPFGEVRRRWFGFPAHGMGVEDMVRGLADEFSVTPRRNAGPSPADEAHLSLEVICSPP
jgi:Zn-dependent peptidase ImmA (M78 family)